MTWFVLVTSLGLLLLDARRARAQPRATGFFLDDTQDDEQDRETSRHPKERLRGDIFNSRD